MFDKAKKLPLYLRILLTVTISIIWIFIASNLEIEIQSNWLLSTIVIAFISSIFFPFNKKSK
jgi:hypothetical protein